MGHSWPAFVQQFDFICLSCPPWIPHSYLNKPVLLAWWSDPRMNMPFPLSDALPSSSTRCLLQDLPKSAHKLPPWPLSWGDASFLRHQQRMLTILRVFTHLLFSVAGGWATQVQGTFTHLYLSVSTWHRIGACTGWIVSPQIHVHLGPQNVTLLENKVFADIN